MRRATPRLHRAPSGNSAAVDLTGHHPAARDQRSQPSGVNKRQELPRQKALIENLTSSGMLDQVPTHVGRWRQGPVTHPTDPR